MTQHKNFFQSAFDAIVEARTREAKRQIAYFSAALEPENNRRPGK